ncbi:hypothetical protein BFW01_g10419 [Lasiodiplodia theobromae]|uniref:Uncharacterized protein n=1 Tax=Lasiodiplodia theobromae TaxID=45133 RepID=A0A8H7IPG6_9PEZI|nr:hypothetical protein BFW01_g10419 [Lasiodiplodia theobromae]
MSDHRRRIVNISPGRSTGRAGGNPTRAPSRFSTPVTAGSPRRPTAPSPASSIRQGRQQQGVKIKTESSPSSSPAPTPSTGSNKPAMTTQTTSNTPLKRKREPTSTDKDNKEPTTAAGLVAMEQQHLDTHRSTSATLDKHAPLLDSARTTATRARSAERATHSQISSLFMQSQVLEERAAGHQRVAEEAETQLTAERQLVQQAKGSKDEADKELMAIALGRMFARLEKYDQDVAEELWAKAERYRDIFVRDGIPEPPAKRSKVVGEEGEVGGQDRGEK